MSGLSTKFLNVSHKTNVRVHFTTFTIILVMTVLFLLPALDNGFPFWYPDASAYVAGWGITHVDPSRFIYYILFIIRPSDPRGALLHGHQYRLWQSCLRSLP